MSAIFSRLLGTFLLCLALLSGGISPAFAQDDPTAPEWAALAERAEDTLEIGRASDRALEQLRSDLASFREGFLSAQDTNQARIDTLQAQIAALGPAPKEDEPSETSEIATRRAELNRQLGRLQAPRRAAEEAYNRANGLIGEIDRTIRDRQTEAVLELGPTPLNPALWGPAFGGLMQSVKRFRDEVTGGLGPDGNWTTIRQNLPAIAVLLAIALALLLRGRTWVEWLTLRLYASGGGRSGPAMAFVVSLGQVVLPVLGAFALREAMYSSGVLGLRGQLLAESIPGLAILFFVAMWLGARLFPRRDTIATPLPLPGRQRREGRYYCGILGLLLCAQALLVRVAAFDRYDDGVIAVLTFPILLTAGLILIRLGRMLVRHEPEPSDGDSTGYQLRIYHTMGRGLMLIGAVGPVLAAIGYFAAAKLLIFPMITSMALLALLAVLRFVVRDFFALFTGKSSAEAGEALTPVLVTFLLVLASLPLFALLWGARITDLWELWARFREGFSVGETRILPSDFLTFAVIFTIGFVMTRLLQGALRTSVLPKTRIDMGGRTAIVAGFGYVGIFLAVIFAITAAGIDLSSIALVAGALSVGIGFGLQNIVSNFVAGIILLIERPISEGDWIEVGGQMGTVREIAVRATRIETFDRTDVIVPNADLVSGVVTNWTRGNLVGRVIVPVGVAYGTDTRKVEALLGEIAQSHPLVVLNPPPAVVFMEFGASSLNFEIRAILRDVNFVLTVKSDMNHQIAERFAAAGIEIPFEQRDVWLRNPEVLRGGETSKPTVPPGPTLPPQRDNDGTAPDPDLPDGDDIC